LRVLRVRYDAGMTARVRARSWIVAAALCGGASVAAQVTTTPPPALPLAEPQTPADAAARETLGQMCGMCHDAERVTAQLRSVDDWTDIINQMAQIGASGTDEQWNQVSWYLLRHYSKVQINKARAAEIAPVLDVTPAVAETIVKLRAEKGPFTTLDDLKAVPGVDAATVEARTHRITF
jgi:competence protein ComEA